MVERGARFDLALGGLRGARLRASVAIARDASRRLLAARISSRAVSSFAASAGRFERGRFEALLEIGALAGEIAEAAANDGGLARRLGQFVLGFFGAALGILEFVDGALVLERDFLERSVRIAAAARRFRARGRAGLGAMARASVAFVSSSTSRARRSTSSCAIASRRRCRKSRVRARSLATGMQIFELALGAGQLGPRRLRG